MRHTRIISRESSSHQKRTIIVLTVIGLAIVLLILVLTSGRENSAVEQAAPIETLAMQEFDEYDELSRQDFRDQGAEVTVMSAEDQEPEDPFLIKGRVKKKQTLFVALKGYGLELSDVHQVIAAMQTVVDFKRTQPGDKYEVHLDQNRRIVKFVYEISPEDISIAERDGQSYVAYKVDVNKRVEEKHLQGVLETSLYDAFTALGESGELSGRFMQLFKYDIDFGTSSQAGDRFEVLVEKITLNGQFYRYGRLYAASYESRALGRTLTAYYYESAKDETLNGYYDQNGRALKRSFLKIPVVGCKMTSPFNLKRMHPILKRIRPHYGIDWAGPTGTKVMAFSDGVVTFADWKGGNGNLLVIEHPHGYTSLYAHLQGFARGIKKGTHVKQGQVVAYLGNTGISTGPHLHFGVKKDGKYIDPLSVDTTHAFTLTGRDSVAFNGRRNEYLKKMVSGEGETQIVNAHPVSGTKAPRGSSRPVGRNSSDSMKGAILGDVQEYDGSSEGMVDAIEPLTDGIPDVGGAGLNEVESALESGDESIIEAAPVDVEPVRDVSAAERGSVEADVGLREAADGAGDSFIGGPVQDTAQ